MPTGAPRTPRTVLLAHVGMLGYALIIAGSFSTGALAAPHLPAATLNAVRFVAASVLMAGLFKATGGSLKLPRQPWRFLLLGALMAVYFVMMFLALRITDPVSTSAVFTLIPFMTAVFGILLLGQRTRAIVWFGLVVAAAGALWVIFRGDPARMMQFHVGTGEMLFFIGCVCQAVYAPLVRLLSRGESTFEFTVWTLIGCTICLVPLAVPQLGETDWTSLSWTVWMTIAYLVVGATAISFLLLQYASMHLPAAKIFPYAYLIPSFVIVIEILLGHGWAPPRIAVGALITFAGLIIIVTARDPVARRTR